MVILNLTSIQLRESHFPILKINVNHLAQILKLLVSRPTFLVDIRFPGQFRITVDLNVSERWPFKSSSTIQETPIWR